MKSCFKVKIFFVVVALKISADCLLLFAVYSQKSSGLSDETNSSVDETHSLVKRQIDERRVVCYYANWAVYRQGTAKFSPQNINPYLCTHLIYAFAGLGKDDTIQTFDKYQDLEKGKNYLLIFCRQ